MLPQARGEMISTESDCDFDSAKGASINVEELSLTIVKGYTKIQAVMFTLIAAADLDLGSAETMEMLKPIYHVLDRAWLVPVHVFSKHSALFKKCYFKVFSNPYVKHI